MIKRLPALMLAAGILSAAGVSRIPVGKTGLSLVPPAGWITGTPRGSLLISLTRYYPGGKERAARITLRAYTPYGKRLPEFAGLMANGIRIQNFTTVTREIVRKNPFFHYNYLFQQEIPGDGKGRFLWINMRIFPYRGRYLVYSAGARSRRELDALLPVFRSIRHGK